MNPQLSVMTQIRGGVFTRADARACGYPDPDIDSLLDTGGWRRIRPGTYAPHQTLTLVDDEMLHLRRLFHVLRRGEPGLMASHQSAAALHALPLWGLDLTNLHLTTRTGHPGLHPGGLHRHVRNPIGPGITLWNKLPLVTPSRAIAEVAATSPLAPAVALTEAALYAGLTTQPALRRAINNLPGTPATRAGNRPADAAAPLACDPAAAQQVLALTGSESASVAESRLRLILKQAGLPAPSPSPPPLLEEHPMDPACALWFPDERTIVEFEPRFPSGARNSTTIPPKPPTGRSAPPHRQPSNHQTPWSTTGSPGTTSKPQTSSSSTSAPPSPEPPAAPASTPSTRTATADNPATRGDPQEKGPSAMTASTSARRMAS